MSGTDKKLCILGCAGFVGSHLTEKVLADTDHSVTGIDLEAAKIAHLQDHERLSFIQADYTQSDLLAKAVREADTVIALTALCNPALYNTEPLRTIDANFIQPRSIVQACAEHNKRLIFFSTSEVYGKTPAALGALAEPPELMREDTTHFIVGPVSRQRWTYATAKQLMERLIYAYGQEQGLEYTIIRPFNFIGPRMDYIPGVDGEGVPRVLACFMEALMFNKPLRLVDGGGARRVFTYIGDAIDAVMRVIARPERTSQVIFNLGHPENEVTVRELAEKMLALYPVLTGRDPGGNCVLTDVPAEEFYGPGYDDCDRRLPDISAAETLLNWHPQTNLSMALELAMKGFLKQYKQAPAHA